MNSYNLICGLFQLNTGRYADFWDFATYIQDTFKNIPYDHNLIKKHIKILRKEIDESRILDQSSALRYLVLRDLETVVNTIDDIPSINALKSRIQLATKTTLNALSYYGIEIDRPEIIITSHFPQPYDDMDWVAFAPDRADYENFGIAPGIYLLESELCPYYSELVVTHEIIHYAIGIKSPELLGRGLEEGIAELFGTLYVGSKLYPQQVVKNVFTNSRFGSSSSNNNLLYLDYTRQAAVIYRKYGLKGICQLIREGRPSIKAAEHLLLTDRIEDLKLERGAFSNKLTNLIDSLLLSYVSHLNVSPLAAYISKSITTGVTAKSIANQYGLNIDIVVNIFDELQNSVFSIVVDNGTVAYSDADMLVKSNGFRYEVNNVT